MFKNNLKIAWRNLLKNKGYSIINIGGLALGMAVVIMIGLWVLDELTFNTYHKNHTRIAQIYDRGINPDSGELIEANSMMYTTGTLLKENYSDYFEHILRANWIGDYTLDVDGKLVTQTGEFIESGVLDMLSLEMIEGSYASLDDIDSVVLSQQAAQTLFGNENPVGQSILINNEMTGVVKGVYKDLPRNTRFDEVKFFANWNLYENSQPERFENSKTAWDDYSFNLYVTLKPEVDFLAADQALSEFFKNYAPEDYDAALQREPGLFMYPMDKWHLYSDFNNSYATEGRITFVWLFIGIGIFVLFLACINFMNLSTARSEKRAKEVGIRKTVGSRNSQLIAQFLSESVLVALISLVFGLVFVLLALPWFNDLAGKSMTLPWANAPFWLIILTFTMITGLLAGSYPALYLSSFNPIKVLKGTFKAGRFSTAPRKVLVVFQFVVSIMLAIGTIIVFNQIQFSKDRPMGYNNNNLIMIEMNNPDYDGKYSLLRNELINTGVVEDITMSSSPLDGIYSSGGGFNWPGRVPNTPSNFGILRVTHDYGNTIGWQFVDGRDFSRERASDSLSIIINEAAVKYMGLKDPIGKIVSQREYQMSIIGVTKDMIMESPYGPTKPTMFFLNYERVNYISIKLKPEASSTSALSKVQSTFAKVVPSANFNFRFVDQLYDRKFRDETRLGNLAGVFTLLAILISCLGLFGLASYVAEQRTKEIGVRKVLGASIFNLWKMLSKDFVFLVFISCVIAIPIAYYFMNRWLQNYEYRMEIDVWVFVFSALGALTVTMLTVSFQAIRAASINPVKSLRSE